MGFKAQSEAELTWWSEWGVGKRIRGTGGDYWISTPGDKVHGWICHGPGKGDLREQFGEEAAGSILAVHSAFGTAK